MTTATMTEAAPAAPAAKKRWVSKTGPIKTKRVNKAFSDILWASKARRVLTGVIGVKEGYNKEDSHISTLICGGGAPAAADLEEMGERYGWELNDANIGLIEAECKVLHAKINANLPIDDERITPEKHAANQAAMKARQDADEARLIPVKAAIAALEAKRPSWATALIVAVHDIDDSDSMSDYFGHKTSRHVAIGWRRGPREDLAQYRAAAAGFPETAHLAIPDRADTPSQDKVEHRENWSMGDGYYLKKGSRHSTGWRVEAMTWPPHSNYLIEDMLPAVAAPAGAVSVSAGGVEISENEEKDGVEIRFPSKPDEAVRSALKANGWRWSRFSSCWYNKRTPENKAFAQSLVA